MSDVGSNYAGMKTSTVKPYQPAETPDSLAKTDLTIMTRIKNSIQTIFKRQDYATVRDEAETKHYVAVKDLATKYNLSEKKVRQALNRVQDTNWTQLSEKLEVGSELKTTKKKLKKDSEDYKTKITQLRTLNPKLNEQKIKKLVIIAETLRTSEKLKQHLVPTAAGEVHHISKQRKLFPVTVETHLDEGQVGVLLGGGKKIGKGGFKIVKTRFYYPPSAEAKTDPKLMARSRIEIDPEQNLKEERMIRTERTILRYPHLDIPEIARAPQMFCYTSKSKTMKIGILQTYFRGGDVTRKMKNLSMQQKKQVALDSATGVAALHAKGIVHSDIKPQNILIDDTTGRAAISDFGLCWIREPNKFGEDASQLSRSPQATTGVFASPEWHEKTYFGYKEDSWQLGMAHYCLINNLKSPPIESFDPMTAGEQYDIELARNFHTRVFREASESLAIANNPNISPEKQEEALIKYKMLKVVEDLVKPLSTRISVADAVKRYQRI